MRKTGVPATVTTKIETRSRTAQPRSAWAWLTGTFLGIGLLPGGPGTWAAGATAIIWYCAARLTRPGSEWLILGTLIAVIAVTIVGIPAASIVEKESGRQDPGHVVIDEVAGQLTALLFVPLAAWHVVLAFILFRFFDILKPPPVRQLERLHGGLGIMVDDLGAGVYALIIGLIVHHWW